MKIDIKKIKIFLILPLLLMACAPKPKVVIEAKRVVIKEISLKSMVLEVIYEVYNPHPVSITIKKVEQLFKLDGDIISNGGLNNPIDIRSKTTGLMKINIKVPFSSSLKSTAKLLKGKTISYSLTSDIKLQTVLGEEKRKIVREGDFNLPLDPTKSLIKIANPKISGGNLEFDLILKIPRPKKQISKTTKVEYNLSIDNTKIAKGSFPMKKGKGLFQKQTIKIKWPLTKGVEWTAKAAIGKLKYYFKLKFDIGEDTEFKIEKKGKFDLMRDLNPLNQLKKGLGI
jgi:LEA14-like dessication related protein